MTLSLFLDAAIAALLVAVLVFAVVLNRRLADWRGGRAELEKVVGQFNQAAERAEAGIAALKAASEASGKGLESEIAKAKSLHDDLAYLVERAEPLADRINQDLRREREPAHASPKGFRIKVEDVAAAAGQPAARPAGERASPSRESLDARSAAERQLAEALARLR